MKAASSALTFLGAVLTSGAARADTTPTATGPVSTSEAAFVRTIQTDLTKRFPSADEARKAGYVR